MALVSAPELLVLHGLRILGMADTGRIAARFHLAGDHVEELLLDYQANGWVRRVGFADVSGWTLSDAGGEEGSRLVAAELNEAGAGGTVAAAHASFVQLNARFLEVITKWQIRPTLGQPMAANDHTDWRWDTDVLKSLAGLTQRLQPIGDELAAALSRFAGYPERLAAALSRVDRGERRWVDAPKIDSCHTVWFELHEDLIATLGLERGS